jgi:hypothetical protein
MRRTRIVDENVYPPMCRQCRVNKHCHVVSLADITLYRQPAQPVSHRLCSLKIYIAKDHFCPFGHKALGDAGTKA